MLLIEQKLVTEISQLAGKVTSWPFTKRGKVESKTIKHNLI